MNTLALKALSILPWFKMAKWLLAELGWQRDVANWLAAENAWYFKMAANAWGATYVADPDALKIDILKQVAIGALKP